MSFMCPTLQPSYLIDFSCVGSQECLASCCEKKLFFLSKPELERLTSIQDLELFSRAKLAFAKKLETSEQSYAFSRMNPNTGQCWMLDRQGGCRFLNEPDTVSLQPQVCAQYPAVTKQGPDGVQHFLSPSCPEVSKLFWHNQELFQLEVQEVEHRFTPKEVKLAKALTDRYLLVREFGASVLQTVELPLEKRLMILFFATEQIRPAYERNDVAVMAEILNDIIGLLQQGDPALSFENVWCDQPLHAVLLTKLLQMRHDRQQGSVGYDEVLQDVSLAFDLLDKTIPLDDRALAAIPRIAEGMADLADHLQDSPYFFDQILLNHWLAHCFPSASLQGLRVNMLAFLLFYLLQRFLLAALAMAYHGEEFQRQAARCMAFFHREWVDDSPMLFAAAMSMADSDLKDLSKILSLLGGFAVEKK